MKQHTKDVIHDASWEAITDSELFMLLPTNADLDNAADRLAIQFESLVDTFIRAETEKLGVTI